MIITFYLALLGACCIDDGVVSGWLVLIVIIIVSNSANSFWLVFGFTFELFCCVQMISHLYGICILKVY